MSKKPTPQVSITWQAIYPDTGQMVYTVDAANELRLRRALMDGRIEMRIDEPAWITVRSAETPCQCVPPPPTTPPPANIRLMESAQRPRVTWGTK